MNRALVTVSAVSLVACSPALRRPVETTEAASQLEQVTVSNANELDPAVSPDARTIAYEVEASQAAPPHIEVMSLAGVGDGGRGEVEYSSGDTIGREPAWIPDGSGLVFLSSHAPRGRELVEMIGEGKGRRPFVATTGDVSFAGEWPAVAPNSASVAASVGSVAAFQTGWPTTRYLDAELGLSDLLGTSVTVIGPGTEPAWSPDGKHLAFVRRADGRGHLFVANADGGDPQQITYGPADDIQPAWSSDGKRLAFCSMTLDDEVPRANLFVVAADGSDLRQLTEGDRIACRPSWGRDGLLYFHANVTDRFHIWRIRPR